MKYVNYCILFGLLLTGSVICVSVFVSKGGGKVLEFSVLIAWFLTFASIGLFFVATILWFVEWLEEYWESMFPLNFGIALFGLNSFQYHPEISNVLIVMSILAAIFVSFAVIKFKLIKSKVLALVLLLLLFSGMFFEVPLFVSLVFILVSISTFFHKRGVDKSHQITEVSSIDS